MIAAPVDAVATAAQPKAKDVQTRWGGDPIMMSRGFVGVPVLFLETFAALTPYRLNPAEAIFVISLMAHKWDERAPFPGYRRIAQWMGKSDSYARKLARDLEIKGLLKRRERIGYTNEFDLTPLFTAIVAHVKMKPKKTKAAKVSTPRTRTVRPTAPTIATEKDRPARRIHQFRAKTADRAT